MSEEWMPTLKLQLPRDVYDRLPRHPSYKYELIAGETWITPRPRYGNARLALASYRAEDAGNAELRCVETEDFASLVRIFRSAFGALQPYASLDERRGTEAAEKALRRTFSGGDGPCAAPASFVALEEGEIVGAILITLVPGGDPSEWDSMEWRAPAPADLWATGKGQPHLTWIFVAHFSKGDGIGTRLLQESVRALLNRGYQSLWSTFLIGNESSLLWHWRNGFELLPNLLSRRRMRLASKNQGRRT